jgi:hypothetical protein
MIHLGRGRKMELRDNSEYSSLAIGFVASENVLVNLEYEARRKDEDKKDLGLKHEDKGFSTETAIRPFILYRTRTTRLRLP